MAEFGGVDDTQAPFGDNEKHHAAIGRQAPSIEGGHDFLALDGWESERQEDLRTWRVWLGVIV